MAPELEREYEATLESIVKEGYEMLENGATALDVVEKTVQLLENTPLFNAGKGAVFAADGTHEMDAAIMEGKELKAGAVSLVTGIKNPVSLARDVMENSHHVFLAGEGAMKFAEHRGYALEVPEYFYDEVRHRQWQEIKDVDTFELDRNENAIPVSYTHLTLPTILLV